VHNSFYEPAGDGSYLATPATTGPWSADTQHGGPPSALAARELEAFRPDPGQRLARVAVDILRPMPAGRLTLATRMVRPGRRIALLETVMECDGQEVLHARGWRIARSPEPTPAVAPPGAPPLPPMPPARPRLPFSGMHTDGYLAAIEWRFVSGGFDHLDPAGGRAWTRPRIPLVPGEDLSPMCRALLVADSGNGIGAVLDPARFLFLNVDLTVVLWRDPPGEWLLLSAATNIGTQGSGMVETTISDRDGALGTATQTLIVAQRQPG